MSITRVVLVSCVMRLLCTLYMCNVCCLCVMYVVYAHVPRWSMQTNIGNQLVFIGYISTYNTHKVKSLEVSLSIGCWMDVLLIRSCLYSSVPSLCHLLNFLSRVVGGVSGANHAFWLMRLRSLTTGKPSCSENNTRKNHQNYQKCSWNCVVEGDLLRSKGEINQATSLDRLT